MFLEEEMKLQKESLRCEKKKLEQILCEKNKLKDAIAAMRSKIDSRKRPFGNSEDGSPEAKSPRVECDNTGKDLNVAGSSTGGMSHIAVMSQCKFW